MRFWVELAECEVISFAFVWRRSCTYIYLYAHRILELFIVCVI
jgi:hypothetical protein